MPDTGAPWNLPYYDGADPPAGHTQQQALAVATHGALDDAVAAARAPFRFTAGSEQKQTDSNGRAVFNHGGPTTPIAVLVAMKASSAGTTVDQLARATVYARSATTFTIQMWRSDSNVAFTGNPCAIDWLCVFPQAVS